MDQLFQLLLIQAALAEFHEQARQTDETLRAIIQHASEAAAALERVAQLQN